MLVYWRIEHDQNKGHPFTDPATSELKASLPDLNPFSINSIKPRFKKGRFPVIQQCDSLGVVIGSDHGTTEVSQTSRPDNSLMPQANDADLHERIYSLPSMRRTAIRTA